VRGPPRESESVLGLHGGPPHPTLSPVAIAAMREQMERDARDAYGGEGTGFGATLDAEITISDFSSRAARV
jgi:hypothetical protein